MTAFVRSFMCSFIRSFVRLYARLFVCSLRFVSFVCYCRIFRAVSSIDGYIVCGNR